MARKFTIALSGNPNSGKTTVFNALTGARQHIANYPGVTVEKKTGRTYHQGYEIEVVDLPGTYSLTAYSLEEIVARDFLVNERPDLVVDIVDASNLDRNLYLAVQFRELGIPLIIALNMVDVAEARGIIVDLEALSALVGVPVVPMVARSGKGIPQLLDAVVALAHKGSAWEPVVISYGRDINQAIGEIEEIIQASKIYDKKYPARWRALKCLEGDSQIVELLKRDPDRRDRIQEICRGTSKHIRDTQEEDPEGIIADHRYGYITGITKKALKRKIELRLNLSDKIDRILTNRVLGPLIMIVILYGIYAFTFSISELPVAWLETLFSLLKGVVSDATPEGILRSLVVSGIIDGVGGVLGFVPLIMFMFFAIAVLEDSGYMARIAYMLDRVLRWFGLHGNSVMAMIISGGITGGCAVPGVMATRTLRDPKERIATLLVVPFMNCGAKLPVYAMLIAAFFPQHKARMLFLLTLLSWAFALFAAKFVRATVLRGEKTPFVMELPPYRAPTFQGLLIHTWERTWQYIKKAGTIILAFSIILWAMMTFPGPSEDRIRAFQERRSELGKELLASPAVAEWVGDEAGLQRLNTLYEDYGGAVGSDEGRIPALMARDPLFPFVKGIFRAQKGREANRDVGAGQREAVSRYLYYRVQMNQVQMEQHQAALDETVAGWIGHALESVTRPLGFDYRVNISLAGGFAAKEVIISTLGTAYSLGETEPGDTGTLSSRLRRDPNWNPLQGFTLIVFTMLYVPCFATVIAIRRESSWRWALFSIAFNLLVAYGVALMIRQAGRALGLGV